MSISRDSYSNIEYTVSMFIRNTSSRFRVMSDIRFGGTKYMYFKNFDPVLICNSKVLETVTIMIGALTNDLVFDMTTIINGKAREDSETMFHLDSRTRVWTGNISKELSETVLDLARAGGIYCFHDIPF